MAFTHQLSINSTPGITFGGQVYAVDAKAPHGKIDPSRRIGELCGPSHLPGTLNVKLVDQLGTPTGRLGTYDFISGKVTS